jgi:hypothetical protein
VKGSNEFFIKLEERLTASTDDQRTDSRRARFCRPRFCNGLCDLLCGLEMAAALAVHTNEIRIAKLANGARPVLLMPGPEIAPCKAAEDRRAPRVRAFALQGEEDFFNAVTHLTVRGGCLVLNGVRHPILCKSF